MALKKYKPVTPGHRQRIILDHKEITRSAPEKSLTKRIKRRAGRNHEGRVTVRHQGGGARKVYRVIDFKRDKVGVEGTIKSIEYDPNRTGYIALIQYKDGDRRYILCPNQVKVGMLIQAGPEADIRPGNALPLKNIPTGTNIHNVEIKVGKGGQLVRSAGTYAVLMAKNEEYVTLKMPSGEVRFIHRECYATVGEVSNADNRNIMIGKAGANRWRGKRPAVRGSAMNACDHPHGGGEGKAPVGHAGPRTPWGKPTLGYKTRNRKKITNKFIVTRRK